MAGPAPPIPPPVPLPARHSAWRLVARFTAAGLLVMVALGAAIAFVARTQAIQTTTDQVSRTTWTTAHGVVEPLLTDRLLAGDPAERAQLDAAVHRFVLDGSLVRVKIWTADGRIVYSDAASLIGQHFELEPAELTALATGGVEADVSNLTRPENEDETQFDRLLEVNAGIRSRSGVALLYEAYFRYDAVAAAGWRAWRTFAPVSLGALLVLQLFQVPFAVALARRLRQQDRQRERLLRHAVDSSTAERRRIAGDLHDGVVQELAGITYALDASRIRHDPDGEQAATIAESARQLRDSIGTLRTLLVDIYPPDLADDGLRAAIEALLGALERRGVAVTAHLDDADDAPAEVAALLYRAAQEAVRNIVSHSHADHVQIAVRPLDRTWNLTVDDDGHGFDLTAGPAPGGNGHLGLRSLRDLFDDAGGALTVRSAPGQGTHLRAEITSR